MNFYLRRNNSKLNLDNTNYIKDLEILKDDVNKNDIILMGEWHGIADTESIRIKLLKFLKDEIDLDYVILETSYSFAYIANKYLESGDERILKSLFESYNGTYLYTKEEYNFIKEIYDLNSNSNGKKDIRLVGIDLEHNKVNTDNYLLSIFDNKNNTDSINNFLNIYNFKQNYFTQSEGDAATKLLEDINQNSESYNKIYGKELNGLKIVLENIIVCSKAYPQELREKMMYNNFKNQYINDKKYYGKLGASHIYKDIYAYRNMENNFASILKYEDISMKNNILSLGVCYYDCRQIKKPVHEKYPYTDIEFSNANIELFAPFISNKDNSSYIFNIRNEDSPFKKDLIWHVNDESPTSKNKCTADYIDYIILINNSKSSESLK